jgi:lysophospholipase L1-like esterase
MKGYLIFVFQVICLMASAQSDIVWWKPSPSYYSELDGMGWQNEKRDAIQRLPSRFQFLVSPAIWEGSQKSSGLSIRFISNAPQIIVRYTCISSTAKRKITADAARGVDLYAIDSDGLWHWAPGNASLTDPIEYVFSQLRPNDNFHKLGREYQLFLPLFSSIENLQIGVPEGSLFKIIPIRAEKPIVVLGSSIVQGEGATRSGMSWTNILSRKIDRNVINLGFLEKDFFNKSLVDLFGEIDARIFVFDGMLELGTEILDSAHLVRNITDAVRSIRSKHPHTPILCSEHAGYSDDYLLPDRQPLSDRANRILQAALNQLKKENITEVYLLRQRDIGMGMDDMSDGKHPNDMGMKRYADAYEKKLREIFKEPVGTLKTQIPIRQRRTPQGYDWEGRHRTMLALNKTESNKILLIGNSITHNWGGKPNTKSNPSWQKYLAPYDVRNFGFGADRIENVLWRIYHDELSDIQPEKILINIGTNNLRVNSNEEITEGLRFLIQVLKVHQPNAEITLLGIYPRRDYEDRIILINKSLRKMTSAQHVRFADIGKNMFLENRKVNEALFNDGLHPNADGYEILGKKIQELLKN